MAGLGRGRRVGPKGLSNGEGSGGMRRSASWMAALIPFGILVKGKDVDVPAGTEYTVYTAGERRVRSSSG